MPRRRGEEEQSLLGRINEDEEDNDHENNRDNNSITKCCKNVPKYLGILVNTIAILLCWIMYLQLLRVQSQLHRQQSELDHLEDIIQHEQKGEIKQLSVKVEQEHKATLYHLAGTFVLIGGLITMFHMRSHVLSMHEPTVQRKILAILAMCPIYSLTSFLSVVFPGLSDYLAIIKDCYEAYVIYQFLSFLIAVLGRGNRRVVVELLAKHADHLKPPLSFLECLYYPDPKESNTAMANAVLLECQVFALQFVFLRPILSILIFTMEMMRRNDNNGNESMPTWSLISPRFYLVMIQNLSVFVAFTGLLRFYHAVHEYIEWMEPFPKFLCIKGVVFMTFWQGLVISIFDTGGATNNNNDNNDDNANHNLSAAQIQNLLICLEMLGFSIAHYFVFPTEEWEEGYIRKRLDMSVGDSIAFGDFISDVKMVYESGQQARAAQRGGVEQKDYSTITAESSVDRNSSISTIQSNATAPPTTSDENGP